MKGKDTGKQRKCSKCEAQAEIGQIVVDIPGRIIIYHLVETNG